MQTLVVMLSPIAQRVALLADYMLSTGQLKNTSISSLVRDSDFGSDLNPCLSHQKIASGRSRNWSKSCGLGGQSNIEAVSGQQNCCHQPQ
jgi:hypothetical protein